MFTESQKRTIAGGVQAHSMGDIYPLCVVGLEVEGLLRYVIKDLSTGLYLGNFKGCNSLPPGYIRQWDRAHLAKAFAKYYSQMGDSEWVDAPERTTMLIGVRRCIVAKHTPPQQVKDFAFRAYQEERQLGRPLTPYEEYQLAVAVENGD